VLYLEGHERVRAVGDGNAHVCQRTYKISIGENQACWHIQKGSINPEDARKAILAIYQSLDRSLMFKQSKARRFA
jgi:hypothetical protein